jgi:hypothetical protein
MVGFDLRGNVKKYPTNSSAERTESESEADSILSHDNLYRKIFSHKINYWIIINNSKEVLGPLTRSEYIRKRQELNIPIDVDVQ